MRRHLKGDIVNFHEPSFEALVRTASNHHPFLNTPGSVIIILRHATAGVVSVGCPLAVTAMVTVCEGGTGADHVTGPGPGLVAGGGGGEHGGEAQPPLQVTLGHWGPQCHCGVCSE